MRPWLARQLRRLAQWLDPMTHLPVADDALLAYARVLTAKWAAVKQSGEYKRHQVYAELIDAFPDRLHRDLAKAIEAAL